MSPQPGTTKTGGDGGRRSAKSPRAAQCRHITGGFMPALPPERPGCPKVPVRCRPLPDPASVRLCLVPDSAPPYDDEIVAGEPPGRARGGADDGAWGGADDGWPTAARGGADDGWPAAATVTPAAERPATVRPATVRPAAKSAAAAPGWQSRFAQVLAETLAGSRPPRQIVPWTTQQAREHIQRLGPRMASV